MKKLFRYGFTAMLAVIVAIAVTGCSKSPVDKICDQIDDVAAQLKDADSEEDIEKIMKDNESNMLTDESDKDYELTDADKDALKKSVANLFEVLGEKYAEFGNENEAKFGIALASAFLDKKIDSAKTIGDLDKNGL